MAKKRVKDLTLFEKTYIPAILKGMHLTLKNMLRPKVTMQYRNKIYSTCFIPRKTGSRSGKQRVERCVRADCVRVFAGSRH
jgi:formate hydrogenlyase subunit 6/NADH:ubiquinone oxidoreductase subunit I